jgi:hypothetical protein
MADISALGAGGALHEPRAGPCDEAAFRALLAIERERARRSARLLLLVLVTMGRSPGEGARMPAQAVFAALETAVREVDLVGWYRTGRVAAAVLVQRAEAVPVDACERIRARVVAALRERVPRSAHGRLRVRVVPLRPRMARVESYE